MNTWIAGRDFTERHCLIKKAFYSEFNLGDITEKDYTHAQKVFERFRLKILGNYHHDLYVQSDILLLADVLETSALKYMKLILLIFCLHLD